MADAHHPVDETDRDVEAWALRYIESDRLADKLTPEPPPSHFSGRVLAVPASPGRPPELRITKHAPKRKGLSNPRARAELLHTFLHHELQAAELMCWAILAFPDTPRAFKGGLAGVARDEIRHMALYAGHLASLGHRYGDQPVRDWFWERVPSAASPAHFLAAMGMGFEGGNLDHTRRFAERFRAVGDEEGARLHERVGAEEIPHVRFARSWFRDFTGSDDFATWLAHLPAPLSPILMRGAPLDREARRAAGLSEAFLDELDAWQDRGPGS